MSGDNPAEADDAWRGRASFELQTSIPSFETRKSGDYETYIVYVIQVKAVSARLHNSWHIKKRYREFYELHQLVKKLGTGTESGGSSNKNARLSFPGKSGRLSFTLKSMGSGKANSQLEKRRERLEEFLSALIDRFHTSLPISTRKHLINFLQVPQHHKQRPPHLRNPSALSRSSTVEKEGYLCKRSESTTWFPRWKHRYFRLVGGGLACYRTELDAQAQGYVRCADTSRCHPDSTYHRFGFVLRGVQQPLYMYAETKEEADSWVESINLVIQEVVRRLRLDSLTLGIGQQEAGQEVDAQTGDTASGAQDAELDQDSELDHRKSDEREGPSNPLGSRASGGEVEVEVLMAGNQTQRVLMLQRKRASSCDSPKAGSAAAWQSCETIRQHRINSAGNRAASRWGSSGQVLLQGYLRKLSSSSIIGRQWRSWYCELLPDGLAYYKDVERSRAYGFVRLAKECKVTISKGRDGDPDYAFRVHDEQLQTKYRFAATGTDEMERWVEALQGRIAADGGGQSRGATNGVAGAQRAGMTQAPEQERVHAGGQGGKPEEGRSTEDGEDGMETDEQQAVEEKEQQAVEEKEQQAVEEKEQQAVKEKEQQAVEEKEQQAGKGGIAAEGGAVLESTGAVGQEIDWRLVSLDDLDIVTSIGAGSVGLVKLVIHKPSGKGVAMKVISKDYVTRIGQRTAVVRESQVQRMLDHPLICKQYCTRQDADHLYIVMELLQGGELYNLLYDDRSPLTGGDGGIEPELARFYCACVVLAVEYLHSKDVVFRDLKTENLVLDKEGYPLLVDYGAVKRLKDGQRTYTNLSDCCSVDNTAPELLLAPDRAHGKAVDFWSLGVLVFELLTGTLPFFNEDQAQSIEQVHMALVVRLVQSDAVNTTSATLTPLPSIPSNRY
jgi:hypothetical protein